MALNMGAFEALDNSELFAVDGGGPATIFLSAVGVAVSPVVMFFNPCVGIGLLFVSSGTLLNEIEKYR